MLSAVAYDPAAMPMLPAHTKQHALFNRLQHQSCCCCCCYLQLVKWMPTAQQHSCSVKYPQLDYLLEKKFAGHFVALNWSARHLIIPKLEHLLVNTYKQGWSYGRIDCTYHRTYMYIYIICSPGYRLATSVAVLAETSLKSTRKLFIFIIKIYVHRIKVSKK